MAKFAYNNSKNASIGHMPFELNCNYHPCVLYKEDINSWSKSQVANKLLDELGELIIIYQKNLYYDQEFQKQAHNKGVKPYNYVLNNKFWLNNKYIKTKRKWKLERKFFELFQVLYPVGKQVYKLELFRK